MYFFFKKADVSHITKPYHGTKNKIVKLSSAHQQHIKKMEKKILRKFLQFLQRIRNTMADVDI